MVTPSASACRDRPGGSGNPSPLSAVDAEKNVVFNSGRYSFHHEQGSQCLREVILIIEDDVHIGGLVAQVLREAGFAPVLVRDVGAARAWRAEGNAPAAVLSDLMVAGSPGPAQLPSELGGIFPSTPLALMTGVPPRRRAALGVTHDRDHRKAVRARDVDRHRQRHAGRGGRSMKVDCRRGRLRRDGARRRPAAARRWLMGNFDGVHIGHQAAAARGARARRRSAAPAPRS